MGGIFGKIVNGEYHEADLSDWVAVTKPAYDSRYQRLTGPFLNTAGDLYEYVVEPIPVADVAPSVLAQVKNIRQTNLDVIINSAGVGQAYDSNIKAALAVSDGVGDTTWMWAGMSATQYATDMGSKMLMTATEWATWVQAENAREKTRGTLIEQQYIEFKVAVSLCEDVALMVTYPDLYKARAEIIMGAADPTTLTFDPVPLV